jgi:protein TonB
MTSPPGVKPERNGSREKMWRCVMSVGPGKIPETIPSEGLGSLRGCLVDGDAEQRQLERRVRRRALAISIVLQTAALTVLVLVPLFAKTERIAMKDFVPMPPYGHPGSPERGHNRQTNGQTTTTVRRIDYQSLNNNLHPLRHGGEPAVDPGVFDPGGNQLPVGPGCTGCVDIGTNPKGPIPPQQENEIRTNSKVVHVTQIDPAMLIHRVEPVYPPLAKQTHREGRVELRAIIGTDGTIQSLQVVSGDPLFLMSAREAVQQWRYKPTYLNGQPVEIDTFITVVYIMQH